MTIHVTKTQQFIVRAALEVSGADARLVDAQLIDDIIRAVLVIQEGGMQAYMLKGFRWSCSARARREPRQVSRDTEELQECTEWFHHYIDEASGEAARRIRGNRKRSIMKMVQEAQHLQRFAGQQLQELELRRRGIFNPAVANWDEGPRHLPMFHANEDAA